MDDDKVLDEILKTINYERTKEEILEHCENAGISLKEYRELQLRALAARRKDNPNYPFPKDYTKK